MIKFDNVTFSYAEKNIIENFSLVVQDGERICLRGKSGIGKTTLLRLLMGLEKASVGTISGVTEKKVAAVFQEDRLLPHKTVMENILLFGEEKTAKETLARLGISDAAYKYPDELSGGIARRASIARALTYGGDIYVFDEPFSGLDNSNIINTAELINEKTRGKTVFVVSHSDYEAELLKTKTVNIG